MSLSSLSLVRTMSSAFSMSLTVMISICTEFHQRVEHGDLRPRRGEASVLVCPVDDGQDGIPPVNADVLILLPEPQRTQCFRHVAHGNELVHVILLGLAPHQHGHRQMVLDLQIDQ